MRFKSDQERREYAYSIFTPEINRCFAKAIKLTNLQIIDYRNRYPEQYQYAENDKKGSTCELSHVLRLNLQHAFKPLKLVVVHKYNGIPALQFNGTHIVRVVKRNFVDKGRSLPKAFGHYHQNELPLAYDDDPADKRPLETLFPLDAVFVKEADNTIIEWWFQDYEGKHLKSEIQLDLSYSASLTPANEQVVAASAPRKMFTSKTANEEGKKVDGN